MSYDHWRRPSSYACLIFCMPADSGSVARLSVDASGDGLTVAPVADSTVEAGALGGGQPYCTRAARIGTLTWSPASATAQNRPS